MFNKVLTYLLTRMTASLPLLPTDDDLNRPASPRVRFQEFAQVWLIAHSLLLDRVCGSTYLSIYVTLNIQHTFLEFRRRLLNTH